jgi:hypothetical protein
LASLGFETVATHLTTVVLVIGFLNLAYSTDHEKVTQLATLKCLPNHGDMEQVMDAAVGLEDLG